MTSCVGFSLNTRYGIVGVPTIILFQESRPVARFNRSRTFKDLVDFIHQSTGLSMDHSPIRQTFKFENNFSTVAKSFLNLVKL